MKKWGFIVGLLTATLVLMAPMAAFALTTAGTSVSNKATASYNVGVSSFSKDSNTITFKVAELIDATLTWQDSGNVAVAPGDTSRVLKYKVSNTGNGTESYSVATNMAVGGDNFDPTLVTVAVDSNGNGSYDVWTDSNSNSVCDSGEGDCPVTAPISLGPTGSGTDTKTIFVVSNIPTGLSDADIGKVNLTTTSQTGTGVAGTTFVGAGDTGVDAVIGSSTGTATAEGKYEVSSVTVTMVKTYTVTDQFGGTDPVPGASVKFSITVTVTGSGTATSLIIKDPIPTYTTYKAGSLKLDSVALTDGSGDDSGDYNILTPGSITVNLGNVPGGSAVKTIEFSVTIN